MLDYLAAIKGKQLFKGFGSCYGLADADLGDEKPVDPPMIGCCPYDDCPIPDYQEWEFQYRGSSDVWRWRLEHNPETGTSRIVSLDERIDHET